MAEEIVYMTNREPVRIEQDVWPIIAHAHGHDGEIESQANRKARMRVRQHADGRALIYGWATSQFAKERNQHSGFLYVRVISSVVPNEGRDMEEIVSLIKLVATEIGWPDLASDCIADLPPTTI